MDTGRVRICLFNAFALALLSALTLPAAAQQRDPFATACMAKKNASPANCACQGKLARANLDRREQQAALSALRADKAGFQKQVKAFGETKAKVFAGKMQKLGERSRAECR